MSFSTENTILISIQNYRNIDSNHPIFYEIKNGVIFVLGLNNVGKSNLLKFFYDFRNIFSDVDLGIRRFINVDEPKILGIAALKDLRKNNISISTFFDQVVNRKQIDKSIVFSFHIRGKLKIEFIVNSDIEDDLHRTTIKYSYTVKLENESIKKSSDAYQQDFLDIIDNADIICDLMTLLKTAIYIPAFRATLDVSQYNHFDIALGQPFFELFGGWYDGRDVKRYRQIKETIENLRVIFQMETLDIQLSHDHKDMNIIADGENYKLSEMGSGIANIIVIILHITMNPTQMLLIDEPEISLHPRMQVELIRLLHSKITYCLIASTHSIGLAKTSGDYIYNVYKSDKGLRISDFKTNMSLRVIDHLNELGYSQFCDLGGNNILLVEGYTDIRVFREILSKFDIAHKFIIWHLGGSGSINEKKIEELKEIERLNPATKSIIFDSERTSENQRFDQKFKGFIEKAEKIGFKVFPTEVHSTENYISQNALDKVFGKGKNMQAGPYEKFDLKKHWDSKTKNEELVKAMNKEDFENTELVIFLKNLVEKSSSNQFWGARSNK